VILLDTHALLWLHIGNRRADSLGEHAGRLRASPTCLLELQLLVEAGRLRLRRGAGPTDLLNDERWLMDEPPAAKWFERALELDWTRDPFDRLLAAHALVRRWKLATADEVLLSRMPAGSCLEL
jgi:PIN domain nuclease of toxin-antitoxin system